MQAGHRLDLHTLLDLATLARSTYDFIARRSGNVYWIGFKE